MSGGSFDYLYQDAGCLGNRESDIENMSHEIKALAPGTAADKDTRKILKKIRQINELSRGLAGVWHGVEWWRSNDWVKEQAMDEIQIYEKAKKEEKTS